MNRPALLSVSPLLAACAVLPACITVAPSVTENRPGPPPGLFVEARVAQRLVVSGGGTSVPARLFLLYASIEAANGEAVVVGPANFELRLPDQTVAQIFDQPRASVLLERTRIAPMIRPEPGPDQPPSEPISNERQKELQRQLFGAGKSEPSALDPKTNWGGYLVIDTRHPIASLDGATLEVSVAQDGAMRSLDGEYRFDQASAATPLTSRLP